MTSSIEKPLLWIVLVMFSPLVYLLTRNDSAHQ